MRSYHKNLYDVPRSGCHTRTFHPCRSCISCPALIDRRWWIQYFVSSEIEKTFHGESPAGLSLAVSSVPLILRWWGWQSEETPHTIETWRETVILVNRRPCRCTRDASIRLPWFLRGHIHSQSIWKIKDHLWTIKNQLNVRSSMKRRSNTGASVIIITSRTLNWRALSSIWQNSYTH